MSLEIVVVGFFGALSRGDFDAASKLLDPDVVWQGLRTDLVCHGRAEVIDVFRSALDDRCDTDALEFVSSGDRVVMGARVPGMADVGGAPVEGQIYNVFTLDGGRITRIDDFHHRSDALAGAGIAVDAGWR